MKYYLLKHSINTREVGAFPQSLSAKNSIIFQEFRFGLDSSVNLEILPEPILQKRARETTYISVVPISNNGFLILKKYFIDFVKKYKTVNVHTWDLKVHHNKQVLEDYGLFHISNPIQEKILDIKNSIFEITDDWLTRSSLGKIIKISNYDDYLTQLKKYNSTNSLLVAKELVLNFSKLDLDIIRLTRMPMVGEGYYFSERLVEAIDKNNFTGFHFELLENTSKYVRSIY